MGNGSYRNDSRARRSCAKLLCCTALHSSLHVVCSVVVSGTLMTCPSPSFIHTHMYIHISLHMYRRYVHWYAATQTHETIVGTGVTDSCESIETKISANLSMFKWCWQVRLKHIISDGESLLADIEVRELRASVSRPWDMLRGDDGCGSNNDSFHSLVCG